MAASRPTSVTVLAAANRPTLQDILSNSAPPPWTLGAFMAYLSQNHCLETLEFTMEAERYQSTFAQLQLDEAAADPALWSQDAQDYALAIWRKLIANYILPCGPREVNLPGPVRDRLLLLDQTAAPPRPAELDEAIKIVYELMSDSVLLPFIDSVNAAMQQQERYAAADADGQQLPPPLPPPQQQQQYQLQQLQQLQQTQDARQGRPRLRMPKDLSSSSSGDDAGHSPKPSFLPQLSLGRRSEGRGRSPSASSADASCDRVGLVDDNGSSTPPAGEPLTPPTTPPTSDWNFSTSPNGLQRAISVHNAGWKRMSAKLGLGGLNRMNRSSRRPNNVPSGSVAIVEASPTGTSPHDVDVSMGGTDYDLANQQLRGQGL